MRRTLLPAALFLLALAARWTVVLRTDCVSADAPQYVFHARQLDAGEWRRLRQSNIHPLYPSLIVLFHRLGLSWENAAYVGSAGLGALALFPMLGIGTRLFGPRIGALTGLVYALTPYLTREASRMGTVGPYLFFTALAIWLLLRCLDGDRPLLSAALVGACASLSYLDRPDGLALFPLAGAAILLNRWPEKAGPRMRWKALAALGLPLLAGVGVYVFELVRTGQAPSLTAKLTSTEWRGLTEQVFSLRPPIPPQPSNALKARAEQWSFPGGRHLLAVGESIWTVGGALYSIGTGVFLVGAVCLLFSRWRGRRTWLWVGGAGFLFLLLSLYTLGTLRLSKRYAAGIAILLLPVEGVALEGVAGFLSGRWRRETLLLSLSPTGDPAPGSEFTWALVVVAVAYVVPAGIQTTRPVSEGKRAIADAGRAIARSLPGRRPCIACSDNRFAYYADGDRISEDWKEIHSYYWEMEEFRAQGVTHLVVDEEVETAVPELVQGLRAEDWDLLLDTHKRDPSSHILVYQLRTAPR